MNTVMHKIVEEGNTQSLQKVKTDEEVKKLPRRDIDGGWAWVVLLASYGAMFISSVTIYSGGLFYIVWLGKYKESETKTSLIGSLSISMVCLLGPLAGGLAHALSCRVVIMMGAILSTLGLLIAAYANSLDVVLISYGLLFGTGTAFIIIPVSIVVGYYFSKKRNTVLSMLTVCAAFGMFVSTPTTSFFLDKFGMTVTFIALAALQCQICITAVICKPSNLETKCNKKTKEFLHRAKSKSKYLRHCVKWLSIFNIFNNISFVLFLLSTVAWNLSQSVVLIHLPHFIKVNKFGDMHIYLAMCTFSICNALGRLLSALTAGKGGLDGILIHFGSLGIISVVSMTFPLYSDIPAGSYFLAGVTGFYTGAPNALMTPIAVDIAGIEHLATSSGLCYFASGIGYLIGPPLAGFLYHHTGVFETSFVIS
ncbi:hypothetical protein CHS0354_033983 [Potamilus streckersoni]|uniref:Major facilitator superfamily (MFS) profile domain-containing protein n=1 Tax=Potamilus streckersoni TaxID=2493646 RepID=A0AAE0T9A5_9BIVA|nr:hypothetical protein CHS0354_033983 [Potamilus streckersoni]KAK3605781.1 hypothetical protein CHS0354_033983 [Potamilus streckersoni]